MGNKNRTKIHENGSGWWKNGVTNVVSPMSVLITAKEELFSEGHHWPPPRGSTANVGGPFLVKGTEYHSSTPRHVVTPGSGLFQNRSCDVPLLAFTRSGSFPVLNASSDSQMNAFGTTAIARVLPTNPAVSVSQFLGELGADGIPRMIGRGFLRERAHRLRSVGDEYLNVEFGWKPFVSDVVGIATTIRDAQKILDQYERDSGRNIRRRYYFPTEYSSSESVVMGKYPACNLDLSFYDSSGTLTTRSETQTDRWFSGCFTYHLETGVNRYQRMVRASQEANRLLGTRLTPETVWNLAPWTWAADWFGNFGDVVRNVSAFQNDGLVMKYGYMMERKTSTTTYTLSGFRMKNSPSSLSVSQSFKTTTKKRTIATPYGFGLNLSSFTPRQWAILGALGLSRSPGQLSRA